MVLLRIIFVEESECRTKSVTKRKPSAIIRGLFYKRWTKITAKIIKLKIASKLALEIFHFYVAAFCMAQKA